MYENELDKVCFAHGGMYADSKDLAKRTVSGKALKDRVYEIVLNPQYGGYQVVVNRFVWCTSIRSHAKPKHSFP